MEQTLFTPRLKLTLITRAERGSPEFEWCHQLRSNEQATWWSIYGRSKSVEDTERAMKGSLPTRDAEEKAYRVVYAVHRILETTTNGSVAYEDQSAEQRKESTEFIGMVTLRSAGADELVLPEHLTIPASAATTTLTTTLGYSFLPAGWDKGYATESVAAVLESCKRARSFWAPYSKVYVQAIVNEGNPASMRVMDKIGMEKRGVFECVADVFLAGEWRTRENLHIFDLLTALQPTEL